LITTNVNWIVTMCLELATTS